MSCIIALALLVSFLSVSREYAHAPIITVDGVDYYIEGIADGPGNAQDIPGHYWLETDSRYLIGKHYNIGPFGEPQWWSPDVPDRELLNTVHGIIDTRSAENIAWYSSRGYTHYRRLVRTSDGSTVCPDKVIWLKYTSKADFSLSKMASAGKY